MRIDLYEEYGVNPEHVIDKLDELRPRVSDEAEELYEKADQLYEDYCEVMADAFFSDIIDNDQLHDAMYKLEVADRMLERVENDLDNRTGGEFPYLPENRRENRE